MFYVQLATAHLHLPLPPLPPFPPLPPLSPPGERGVGDLVKAGRAFVTLGDVLCFFVAEFCELAGVFCRFSAEVCLPWAILAPSSCCRRVRVGEHEHKWGPGRGIATYTWRKNSKRLPGSMEVKYPSPQYEVPVAE
jgi:hypothetical protein